MNKTKKMIVDFGGPEVNKVSMQGEEVEVVEEYRYLRVYLNSRLNWKCNTEAVFMKGHTRQCLHQNAAYLLQVCGGEYNLLCRICCSSVRASDSKKLNKLTDIYTYTMLNKFIRPPVIK